MSAPLPLPATGTEWLVDAYGCKPEVLRSISALSGVFALVIADLDLRPIGAPVWHAFPGESGVTGLVLLSESHLACHTYPETGFAAFNLYCCQPRRAWPWDVRLADLLGAREVTVRAVARGVPVSSMPARAI